MGPFFRMGQRPLFLRLVRETGPGKEANMREERLLAYLKAVCPGRACRAGGKELERVLGVEAEALLIVGKENVVPDMPLSH